MVRHPVLEGLFSLVASTPAKPLIRRIARSVIASNMMPMRRKQQVYNMLARKVGQGETELRVRSRLPNGHSAQLQLNLEEDMDRRWYFWGYRGYEQECVDVLYKLLATRKYKTVLEVGANIGYYTILLASTGHLGYSADIYAFEPFPPVFGTLKGNVELNPDLRIHIYQAAVCDIDGIVRLHLPEDPEAKTNASLVQGLFPQSGSVDCPAVRLDTFVKNNGLNKVDLLKLDCEGAEEKVIVGAEEILEKDSPDILCEVLEGYEDILTAVLGGKGYLFYHLTSEGPILTSTIVANSSYRDYLFTVRHLG